jgi:predicted phosphodiesterase
MTKFHILSDLHFEFGKHSGMAQEISPVEDADYLVLVGDISVGSGAVGTILDIAEQYKRVFYVPGNHEIFGQEVSHLEDHFSQAFKGTNVHVFPIRSAEPVILKEEQIVVVGGTYWTDFDNSCRKAMGYAKQVMPEYSCGITVDGLRFIPSDTVRWNKKAAGVINDVLREYRHYKKVVITHHLPSEKSSSLEFVGSRLNPAFYSRHDHLVKQADLWIHGHTHIAKDYKLDNTRVVCNPGGYTMEYGKNGFDPHFVVEI